MDENIDWLRIFKEYVKHVATSEGTDFLGPWTVGSPLPEFTEMTPTEREAITSARDAARSEIN
jgi:hypothetical protein